MPKAEFRRRLAELLTIFLGVVLAFLADDFRERLSEARAERVVLEGLRADFEQNARQLQAQLEFNARVESATVGLMGVLERADGSATVVVHDTLLMAAAVGVNTYDPIRGTLDALLNSGELRLVQNADLRRVLAEWPAAVADVRESQRSAIESIDVHLIPVLLEEDVALDRVLGRYREWSGLDLPPEASTWETTLPNTRRVRTVLALRVRQQEIATNYVERLAGLEARITEQLR